MSKIDYTLWPNANGTLGQNKVQIPDGVTTMWPDGDALVDNFVYNGGELVGFVDTKALINNTSKTSTINYDFVDIHLENIGEGDITFNLGERCKNFTVTYGSSFAEEVFKYKGCKNVGDIIAVDPDYLTNDIIDGVWTQSLADLTEGWYLNPADETYYFFFEGAATTLLTFNSDLSSLTIGQYMFMGCSNLHTFISDLSSLTIGHGMFMHCSNLPTFDSNLSSLTNGYQMFYNCTNLTSFTSDLSSLTNGYQMFYNCKLDSDSLMHISETINHVSDLKNDNLDPWNAEIYKTIHIGIGSVMPTEKEHEYLTQIHEKGWEVYANGSYYLPSNGCCASCCASIATLDETGETQEAPIPFYAKPVPATKDKAEYVDENGNYYNILGAQFIYVSDPETYGMFLNEEDAAANMRLKRIGEEEIETA